MFSLSCGRFRRMIRVASPLVCLLPVALAAQAPKKPITQDMYDSWRSLGGTTLTPDGKWLIYTVSSSDSDGELILHATTGSTERRIPVGFKAGAPQLSANGRYLVYQVAPTKAATDSAKKAKKKAPKTVFQLMALSDGASTPLPGAASASFSGRDTRYLFYTLERDTATARKDSAAKTPVAGAAKPDSAAKGEKPKPAAGAPFVIRDLTTGTEVRVEGVTGFVVDDSARYVLYKLERPETKSDSAAKTAAAGTAAKPDSASKAKKPKTLGAPLVVRDLTTGTDVRLEDVESYVMGGHLNWLAYTVASATPERDGIYLREMTTGRTTPVLTGKGVYKGFAFDTALTQFVFLSNKDEFEKTKPRFAVYHGMVRAPAAVRVVAADAFGPDSAVGESATLGKNGTFLTFTVTNVPPDSTPASAGTPAGATAPAVADSEKVSPFDLWNYKDTKLQPEQAMSKGGSPPKSLMAMVDLKSKKIVRIGTPALPSGTLADNGRYVLISDGAPYEIAKMWADEGVDVYLLDLQTGVRQALGTHLRQNRTPAFSPGQQFLVWADSGHWYTRHLATGQIVKVTEHMPDVALLSYTADRGGFVNMYGVAGWTKDDARMIVRDEYDLWELDPRGVAAPRLVTAGVGRRDKVKLTLMPPFDEGRRSFGPTTIDLARTLWFTAYGPKSKAEGWYRMVDGKGPPERVTMEEVKFGSLTKAKQAEMYMTTKETSSMFPDVWVGPSPTSLTKMTDANPQQNEYRWSTSELVEWQSTDGVPLQGILYKPEGFDPSKKYPMLVWYYEKQSDDFHKYLHFSGILNMPLFLSAGYLIFLPDIVYTIGQPGQSAVKAVVPGVQSLIARGFVKPDAIGCGGHSFGGYETVYMITQTKIFNACYAGAPVVNMTSAYGGIRWGSGAARPLMYENGGQSRIGASIWTGRDRYIENSGLFYLDRVNTALLILHNDKDGAVPWYQGIELFVGLRRLGKEAYLFNYNGQDHGLSRRPDVRDFEIRMFQFFGTHLKGDPAPRWMTDGIPFEKKGKDDGGVRAAQAAMSGATASPPR